MLIREFLHKVDSMREREGYFSIERWIENNPAFSQRVPERDHITVPFCCNNIGVEAHPPVFGIAE